MTLSGRLQTETEEKGVLIGKALMESAPGWPCVSPSLSLGNIIPFVMIVWYLKQDIC